jgi:hypothetical protein
VATSLADAPASTPVSPVRTVARARAREPLTVACEKQASSPREHARQSPSPALAGGRAAQEGTR